MENALATVSNNSLPSGVNPTDFVVRTKRGILSSPSSCLMLWLMADWDTPNSFAAREKDKYKPTPKKVLYKSADTAILVTSVIY